MMEIYEWLIVLQIVLWMHFLHNWIFHDAWPSKKGRVGVGG